MKFPKLIPNWFMRMPATVKLALCVLIAIWIWALIVDPMPILFISSVMVIIASIIRLLRYFIDGR